MNAGYAISDFVLALACFAIAFRARDGRPGIALACVVIGIAAVFGVLRYSGFANVGGPHRFLSLLGATAALPLLAASLAWPASRAAKSIRGAALVVLVASGIGVAITAGAGIALWSQVVPAASALALLFVAFRLRAARSIACALLLAATFALVAARVTIAGFEPVELLHYGMAAALLLLCF